MAKVTVVKCFIITRLNDRNIFVLVAGSSTAASSGAAASRLIRSKSVSSLTTAKQPVLCRAPSTQLRGTAQATVTNKSGMSVLSENWILKEVFTLK